jgi:putative transposase
MRQPRIKVPATEGIAVYHCMTRTVNGERLFQDTDKEILRRQLWQVADYTGVEILTYAILSNHFHVLLRIPQSSPITDAELLRRYHVLYPHPTQYQVAHLDVIRAHLATNDPEAAAWRKRQLALMGDVSQFMKLVKQRFSIWFNQTHARFGTLWAERFKSVLVEPQANLIRTMSAYIDLNSVRAGLVSDPMDYRFCGYAEAVAGNPAAQRGLITATESTTWSDAQTGYRQTLFGAGARPRVDTRLITLSELERVIAAGGHLPLATVLRCRVRYFNDSAILGTTAFVAAQLALYRKKLGLRPHRTPRTLPPITDWGDLAALRGLRRHAFG